MLVLNTPLAAFAPSAERVMRPEFLVSVALSGFASSTLMGTIPVAIWVPHTVHVGTIPAGSVTPPAPVFTVAEGLQDTARHVIGCHLTEETRVQEALDDVASLVPGIYCSPSLRMSFDSKSTSL